MNYRQLEVWKKAMNLALSVYRVTASFPKQETYGLVSQMRRAAISIPSNIAEGQGRFSLKEDERFLLIARGSLLELETQTLIAERLSLLDAAAADDLLRSTGEVGRLLNGFVRFLRKRLTENRQPRTDNR